MACGKNMVEEECFRRHVVRGEHESTEASRNLSCGMAVSDSRIQLYDRFIPTYGANIGGLAIRVLSLWSITRPTRYLWKPMDSFELST